jgi:hypothetical protein
MLVVDQAGAAGIDPEAELPGSPRFFLRHVNHRRNPRVLLTGSTSLFRSTGTVGGWLASQKGAGRSGVSSCAITAGDRQQGAVTGSSIWTRVRLRQAAMFGFVMAVIAAMLDLQLPFGGDATAGYAALSTRSTRRSPGRTCCSLCRVSS